VAECLEVLQEAETPEDHVDQALVEQGGLLGNDGVQALTDSKR
jgi:hypothetical protein